MALASSTVWEIRQQATSSNVNGGAFNPGNPSAGTDYSQQTASQYTFSDLASSNGTSNPATISSAGHSFTSADIGNIIQINAGTNFITGFYELVSLSGSSAILDRACGTSASLSGGTYHVGGALSLGTVTDTSTLGAMVAGNKAWVLGGATNNVYTLTSTLSIPSGTALSLINFEGYASVRGDKPAGSSRPVFSTRQVNPVGFNSISNLIITAVQGAQLCLPGQRTHFYSCKFIQAAASTQVCVSGGTLNSFYNCEFINYLGAGLTCTAQNFVTQCYFHDSVTGINNTSSNGSTFVNNIFDSMTTFGISYPNGGNATEWINGNTFFGGLINPAGTAINLGATAANQVMTNNIITGYVTGISATDGSSLLQGTSFYLNNNNFFNNTTDVSNLNKGLSDIALNPSFQNVGQLVGSSGVIAGSSITVTSVTGVVAGQDFCNIVSASAAVLGQYAIVSLSSTILSLSSTPGGSSANAHYQITTGHNFYPGSAMVAGSPGPFPAALTTGFNTIGAVERNGTAQSSSGSGGSFVWMS